jgi:sRNA-binding protein
MSNFIETMPPAKRKKIARAMLAWLIETYPRAFVEREYDADPLKIGILHDIMREHPETKRWKLIIALDRYTNRTDYLQAMIFRFPRIDLQGNPTDQITDAHAAHAAEKMAAKIRAKAVKAA